MNLDTTEGRIEITVYLDKAPISATYFFINVGNNDFLDTGGTRNPDLMGYATFARVTEGMDVVRRIQAMESNAASEDGGTSGQILTDPVIITRAYRQ